MESLSMPSKQDGQLDTHGTSNLGEMSKYRCELSDKKILTEKNILVDKSQSEYSISQYDQNEKENKQVLPSYQSSFRQHTVQEYVDNKRQSEIDPYSALLRNSEYSKTSTFVVYPKIEDYQSQSTLQKIQKEFQANFNIKQKEEHVFENSTKYNFLNEGEQLTFKEEASNMYYSEMDQSVKQMSQKSFQFQRILSKQEVNMLSLEDKNEYIQFLKNEISQELKKDLKFKQMQEEIQTLNKNYKCEKELLQTEQDNRKLQIWILEDKKKQILIEYDQKLNERNNFFNLQNEIKQNIDHSKSKTQEYNQLIYKTQVDFENLKKEQVQLYFNQESLNVLKQKLKSEYDDQSQQLNQLLLKRNENQNVFDLNKQKEDFLLRNQENQQKMIFQKDTAILGLKKEMKRIEDDIVEADLVKCTIKEEKDMYETQLSFLQKQKIIFKRDVENLQKKKKFQDDFIHYGEKSNDNLFDSIKENKIEIGNFKQEKNQLCEQIQSIKMENKITNQDNELIQEYLLQLEDNIKQIVEITKFQDQIFKDSQSYENIRSKLQNLLNAPKLVLRQNQMKYNESCRPMVIQTKNNELNDSKINARCLSNKESKLNVSTNQDGRTQKDQNFENQETKRIFSDRGMSPIEKESVNSIGFMGLGKSFIQKNKGKNVDLIFYEEFGNDDQASQITQEELNQNECKTQNLKESMNIDKISKITSQQKLQSPFTIRSIAETQQDNNKRQNQDQQRPQSRAMPQKKSTQNPQNKANDLKSFLTQNQNQEVANQQDRLKMINQIRSCSPLKQFGAVQNVKQNQNDKFVQQKQVQKKQFQNQDEYQEFIMFNEIQKKNQMIKKGLVKQIIYLDEGFINRNSSRKNCWEDEEFQENQNYIEHQNQLDQFIYEQNFNRLQQNLKKKNQTEKQNKKMAKQFQTFEVNKQVEYQKRQSQNQIFIDKKIHQNTAGQQKQNFQQENQMTLKSKPFRRSISPQQISSQNSSEKKVFAQAVKMTILKGYQNQLEAKNATQKPYISTQQVQHKNNMSIQYNKNSQEAQLIELNLNLSKKNGTAQKIETKRENQDQYFENRKQFSSSLVNNNITNQRNNCDQARAAPLRKSVSQRREEQEKKSDYQSVNFQPSTIQQSLANQNQFVYNQKQAPKIEQMSIKSQQVAISPPLPAFKAIQIDHSKQSEEIHEININSINRDFDQSLKSTRTHCANIPNKLLNNQEFQNEISFQNAKMSKKNNYNAQDNKYDNNINSQNKYNDEYITFKKSQNSQSRNEIKNIDLFNRPQEIQLNLKSNFARKSVDKNLVEQKKQYQQNIEINIQNEDKNNIDQSFLEMENRNHNALNVFPLSSSSFQNNSIYQEFINKPENDRQQAVDSKIQNYNKTQSQKTDIKVQSTQFNKYINQNPVFQQPNLHQISQNSQLNLKSNFSKIMYEKSQNQNLNIQNSVNQQYNHKKSVNSSPRQLSASGQSRFSQSVSPINQIQNMQNKNENQSQNQLQLDKMRKELQYLQSQIGDGFNLNEPKSALIGNYNKDLLKNDHCFSGSDIYIEPVILNTQRLDQMPPINYRAQKQNSITFSQNQFSVKNLDQQSQGTLQTKFNIEKHNISQDQNIRIPTNVFESRSELSNMMFNDQHDIKKKFRQLQDDLNEDARINECEKESCNTYLSMRDQADIISQLRSCKSKKLN